MSDLQKDIYLIDLGILVYFAYFRKGNGGLL